MARVRVKAPFADPHTAWKSQLHNFLAEVTVKPSSWGGRQPGIGKSAILMLDDWPLNYND